MQKKVDVPLDSQETIINYSKYQIGDWAEVYTTDKVIMKRYEKFCQKHPDFGTVTAEDQFSMTFSVHPKCASLFPKAPRKVEMTDERKEQLRMQMKAIRSK